MKKMGSEVIYKFAFGNYTGSAPCNSNISILSKTCGHLLDLTNSDSNGDSTSFFL